jgi:hypothetical protein
MLFDILSVHCALGRQAWSGCLRQLSTAVIEGKFVFIRINYWFYALIAIFFRFCLFDFCSLCWLLSALWDFGIRCMLDGRNLWNDAENWWESHLWSPGLCLLGWCSSFWNWCLIDAVVTESATDTFIALIRLLSVLHIRISKRLGSHFAGDFILCMLRRRHCCLHLWLRRHTVVISEVCCSCAELRLWLLDSRRDVWVVHTTC